MRTILILMWMLVPLGAVAYHYGPGVEAVARDQAALAVAQSKACLDAGDPAGAVEAYEEALKAIPTADVATIRRLRLEHAKACMESSDLAKASQTLGALAEELEGDSKADENFVDETRDTLARSDFYVAWLKRLEGMTREEWEPHVESARQTWRLLAAKAEARGDTAACERHASDLEAVIRLARMNPEELQGLPLPSQCKNCQGGKCRNCNGKGKKPGRKPGDKKPQDARGAGGGVPPDGSGS